jgi:hypothetical protein
VGLFLNMLSPTELTVNLKVCVLLNSKPAYVRLPEGKKELYEQYGPDSLEEWHKKHHLYKP